LAEEARRLADDEHLTTREIAERLGWSLEHKSRLPLGGLQSAAQTGSDARKPMRPETKYLDAEGYLDQHDGVTYLVHLGRAIHATPPSTLPGKHPPPL
jgi:hypothetical protein